MLDLWVNEIMTKEVTTCHPKTSLHDVVQQLHREQFSCLIIVEGNKPLGIITERDMVTILADMLEDVSWDNLAVENFMTVNPITITEDISLFEAVDIIRFEKIRHVPVVTGEGDLIGVLTQTDIINGYHRSSLE